MRKRVSSILLVRNDSLRRLRSSSYISGLSNTRPAELYDVARYWLDVYNVLPLFFVVCITTNSKQSFKIKPKYYFITLHFFKFIKEVRPCNVSYAEFRNVKLDFRFGLQPVLSLTGLCWNSAYSTVLSLTGLCWNSAYSTYEWNSRYTFSLCKWYLIYCFLHQRDFLKGGVTQAVVVKGF